MKTMSESEAEFWQKEAAKAAAHAMDFFNTKSKHEMCKYMQEIARMNYAKAMRHLDEALGYFDNKKAKK